MTSVTCHTLDYSYIITSLLYHCHQPSLTEVVIIIAFVIYPKRVIRKLYKQLYKQAGLFVENVFEIFFVKCFLERDTVCIINSDILFRNQQYRHSMQP